MGPPISGWPNRTHVFWGNDIIFFFWRERRPSACGILPDDDATDAEGEVCGRGSTFPASVLVADSAGRLVWTHGRRFIIRLLLRIITSSALISLYVAIIYSTTYLSTPGNIRLCMVYVHIRGRNISCRVIIIMT